VSDPQPGALSGTTGKDGWIYCVWDPQRGWVDVGYDRRAAERRAAEIKARERDR